MSTIKALFSVAYDYDVMSAHEYNLLCCEDISKGEDIIETPYTFC